MRKIFYIMLFMPFAAWSQSPEILQVRSYRSQSEKQLLTDFKEFISIPNVASDLPNIKKNADWMLKYMAGIGIEMFASIMLLGK